MEDIRYLIIIAVPSFIIVVSLLYLYSTIYFNSFFRKLKKYSIDNPSSLFDISFFIENKKNRSCLSTKDFYEFYRVFKNNYRIHADDLTIKRQVTFNNNYIISFEYYIYIENTINMIISINVKRTLFKYECFLEIHYVKISNYVKYKTIIKNIKEIDSLKEEFFILSKLRYIDYTNATVIKRIDVEEIVKPYFQGQKALYIPFIDKYVKIK